MPAAPTPTPAPHVAIRVTVTTNTTTTRSDLTLTGSGGLLRREAADGTVRDSTFETAHVWPTVRRLLPALPHVVAAPAISRRSDRGAPPADLATATRHAITITVATQTPAPAAPAQDAPPLAAREALALRTWLVTDDRLVSLSASPDGSTTLSTERAGALAATLQWDVAGALDLLVRALTERGAA